MVEIIKRTFNPKHSYTHSHTEPNPVITIVFPVGNTIVITGFGSVCDVFCGRLRRGSNSLLVSQEELNQNLGLELHVVHVGRLVLQHLKRTRTHTRVQLPCSWVPGWEEANVAADSMRGHSPVVWTSTRSAGPETGHPEGHKRRPIRTQQGLKGP